ncbi:MAG: hypothetical protein ABFD92_14380 [Planctomycetaceae bacterium]|nr:hypothetical protein [Planctomycetaceae bacterium]
MEAQPSTSGAIGRLRQTTAALCLLVAAVAAIGLGLEIANRLRLFWFTYNSQPGMNHVADGYFSMVYLASAAAMVMGLAAAWMFHRRLWRVTAGSFGALNLALCAAFLVLHQTAMLVTYSEFVTIYGP